MVRYLLCQTNLFPVVTMEPGTLIQTVHFDVAGRQYEVAVYVRPDGLHSARTIFAPGDIIVNDGPSLEEVLSLHRRLLPLAIDSRLLLRELRYHS